jgi:hypothetical protein
MIEFVQPSPGSPQPEYAGLILMDGPHQIIAQAVGISRIRGIRGEFFRIVIQPACAADFSAKPEHTRPVFINGMNEIVAQAVWIVRVKLAVGEYAGLRIEAIHAIAQQSFNPECASQIFMNRGNGMT